MKKLIVLCMAMFLSSCAVLKAPICNADLDNTVMTITDSNLAAVLHFADGKADLSKNDLAKIKEVAKRAVTEDAYIVVYGHASHRTRTKDPIQRIIVNLEISNDRAVNVAKALIDAGVPMERISSAAMFDSRPVKKEKTRADEAANRRAEIYLYWFE
ncbi:MAG: OmpA family protein [Alphaproteobacteria bacterium]|nr:OmpA family protein [Alphaproteobacteria bacterium]